MEIPPDPDTQMEDVIPTSENKPVKSVKKRYIIGDTGVAAWRENMEIKNPLVDGLSMLIRYFLNSLINCHSSIYIFIL